MFPARRVRPTLLRPRHALLCLLNVLVLVLTAATCSSQTTYSPPPAPIVTMSPHHGNDRYWLSGQANIIFQGNLPFHSPYDGTNSFQSGAEYKTSLLGTVYTAHKAN